MRYLLALTLLLCQLPLVADVRMTMYDVNHRDTNEFYESGYKVEIVEYDGHEYLIVRMKHTDNFTVIHYIECKTCKNWPVNILEYQGCVEMRPGGRYVVDQSGYVET